MAMFLGLLLISLSHVKLFQVAVKVASVRRDLDGFLKGLYRARQITRLLPALAERKPGVGTADQRDKFLKRPPRLRGLVEAHQRVADRRQRIDTFHDAQAVGMVESRFEQPDRLPRILPQFQPGQRDKRSGSRTPRR